MLNAAFDLGLGRRPAPAPLNAARQVISSAAEPSRLRVLIIDDDPADIALMDRALRRMVRYEVQVMSAGSLATARWVLSAEPQDLILVDYSLPQECGTELLRELTAEGSTIPLILLTSLWTAEIEAEVLEAGGVACLAKDDLTPRIMETTVRQALRGQALENTLHHVMANPVQSVREGAIRPHRRVDVEKRYDMQCLAVDALATWQRQRDVEQKPSIAMRLNLTDHPIYVHASEAVFQSAFAWVSAALPLTAACGTAIELSVFEREGRGEVVIQCNGPATVRIGPDESECLEQGFSDLPMSRSEVSIGSGGGHVVELVSPSNGKRTSVALPLVQSAQRRA